MVNLFFASLYWLAGPDALAGARRRRWRGSRMLFFSVQTLATIGYGKLVPNTSVANVLVALEALVGLLGFAILSGLLFARFSRPTANIVSAARPHRPVPHGWALMFRLVNLRKTTSPMSTRSCRSRAGSRRTAAAADASTCSRSSATRSSSCRCIGSSCIRLRPAARCADSPRNRSQPRTGNHLPHQRRRRDVCAERACENELRQDDIVWGARFDDMYLTDVDRVAIDLTRFTIRIASTVRS